MEKGGGRGREARGEKGEKGIGVFGALAQRRVSAPLKKSSMRLQEQHLSFEVFELTS